jgi:branched-chain amino acid aminotransferase
MPIVPFDDRDGWIWLDGEFIPWREAKIHVLTHALHYASAVFEGERMYNGNIFELTAHSQRLVDSARILDFDIPYSVAEIDEASRATCAKNGLVDCYLRPIAWRGTEMIGVSAQDTKIHLAIAVWEWPSYFDPETKAKGIRMCWAKYKRPSPETEPVHAKATGLYMICTISKHAAEKAGYTDAMMLDYRGYVAESTGSNVFFVKDGALHTPDPDCFLNGITRQSVIKLAKSKGYEVIERHILPEELSTFSECFVVGTAAEVTPVAQIGDYVFTPGALSLGLMDDYSKWVRGDLLTGP